MLRRYFLLFMVPLGLVGCAHDIPKRVSPAPGCLPTYSQYHSDTFRWGSVARVLVLPFRNESKYTRAGEEINTAFRAEMQQLGRFEVVASAHDAPVLSTEIHKSGKFDEAELIRLKKLYSADVIIYGTVTQYSPYPRPKVGIIIQAVNTSDGKVIGSVDGLWDANNLPIAKRAQGYYLQRKPRGPYVEANWIFPDDGHADEIALLSPALFQRFVCSEVASLLVQDPAATGIIFAPHGTDAVTPAPTKFYPESNAPVTTYGNGPITTPSSNSPSGATPSGTNPSGTTPRVVEPAPKGTGQNP